MQHSSSQCIALKCSLVQFIAGAMLSRDNLCRQLKPWIENSLKKDDGDNIDVNVEPPTVAKELL